MKLGKYRRLWLPILAIAGLAALQLTFLRLDDSGSIETDDTATPPRYTVSGADMTHYNVNGEPTMHGTADTVEYFDEKSGRATTLHVELLADSHVNWQLDSPTAVLPPGEQRYFLQGPVIVNGRWQDTGEPVRINGTQVWVDPEAHAFYSDTPVEVLSAARNGNAVGMRGDWLSHRLQLQHDVRMIYVVPR